MALDKQIHLYSVDTGNFYTGRERRLHWKRAALLKELKDVRQKIDSLDTKLLKQGYSKKQMQLTIKGETTADEDILLQQYGKWHRIRRHKSKLAKKTKDLLSALLADKVQRNEQTGGRDHTRILDPTALTEKNIISVFESSLTRMIGSAQNELTDALIVVQVYYFDLFQDLLLHGFSFHGERYRYYTSSAGQIRKKKAVFMKEALWQQYEKSILCGLTIDKINEKGGINVNKHLAYMALTNSATDVWTDFDIDKSIVVDDFTTNVFGTFDLIDDTDYTVKRVSDAVSINHTDGAGMVLTGHNRMIRAPWIKGLLGVFDFVSFIKEHRCSAVIKDIYGQEHDVISEDIQVIFTKSQFKMWKYYDSWEEYKDCFKKYGCTAGVCNEEEERIKNTHTNYQILQTLTDLSDDELSRLAQPSADRLVNLSSSAENMMAALGVTSCSNHMTPLQKAVKLYPSLLNDNYVKTVLRDIKNSLIHKYREGKLEIEGKYLFILPDFYAACCYWFGGSSDPAGLLDDGEVFCLPYRRYETLDCLRSPHLYREHAIRKNTACQCYSPDSEDIGKWFTTNALYTSCHDLISKMLQFDVDGDKSLVIADPEFVKTAARNMAGTVPLYYKMRESSSCELNSRNIYQGLIAAFTGGNIGLYSNDIAKIWNSDVFINGSREEKDEAEMIIKLLCMENNFVIDYAKTLYKPQRPKEIGEKITRYTNQKVPAFFRYAKEKTAEQTAPGNGSSVNRLENIIPNPRLNMRKAGVPRPDYKLLMHNSAVKTDENVIREYNRLNQTYHYKVHMQDAFNGNIDYIALTIRNRLSVFGYSEQEVCDMLVQYLYGKESRSKESLWFSYGHFIVENLQRNLCPPKTKTIQCSGCGEWFEVSLRSGRKHRCDSCQKEKQREYQRISMARSRQRAI